MVFQTSYLILSLNYKLSFSSLLDCGGVVAHPFIVENHARSVRTNIFILFFPHLFLRIHWFQELGIVNLESFPLLKLFF